MELTDEQYNQVAKFVDGELVEAEHSAFESMLPENETLREEVELYEQIRSLGSSIAQKLGSESLSSPEGKSGGANEGMLLIKQARGYWENEQEDNLKRKHGIAIIGEDKNKTERPGSGRRINVWMKLAVAAALTGIISIVVTWYLGKTIDNPKVAVYKQADSANARRNARADTSMNLPHDKTSAPINDLSPEAIADREENKIQKQREDNRQAFDIPVNQVKAITLFAQYFKPDAVPSLTEGPLESAFDYYEKHKYNEAVTAFNNVDLGPATRDLDNSEQRLLFYIHYYKALSHLASNGKPSNAIAELKKAISYTPNKAWQTKVEWYLALAYLKNNEVNNARKWLIKVAKKNAPVDYRQKAMQLIKQLQ